MSADSTRMSSVRKRRVHGSTRRTACIRASLTSGGGNTDAYIKDFYETSVCKKSGVGQYTQRTLDMRVNLIENRTKHSGWVPGFYKIYFPSRAIVCVISFLSASRRYNLSECSTLYRLLPFDPLSPNLTVCKHGLITGTAVYDSLRFVLAHQTCT